ncbi:MAG TPA: hypothetical protein VJ508_06275, partial [Saprospiraceae bacterium]|nr:hypothetical protein [Saprospiraceae bacterium]
MAFLLQFVFRYRHQVIRKNFIQAFGSAERGELNLFFSRYYLYLGKIFRQIIVRQNKTLLVKRLSLDSIPEIEDWLTRQKSIILVFGHVGNWEWAGSFVGLKYPDQVCA